MIGHRRLIRRPSLLALTVPAMTSGEKRRARNCLHHRVFGVFDDGRANLPDVPLTSRNGQTQMQPETTGATRQTQTNADAMRLALLGEILETPGKIAVVVIDMQRDFCSPSGAFGCAGMDISANERIVRPLNAFAIAMRNLGALIVWIRQMASPRHMSPAIIRRLRRAPERLELCIQGSKGAELAEGLEVDPADAMVEKFRYSAFFGSSLDQILRSAGIQTTVLVGTAANGCVDATARDAAQLDYDVVIARDLTGYSDATLAASALQNLDRHFALVSQSSEILSQMA